MRLRYSKDFYGQLGAIYDHVAEHFSHELAKTTAHRIHDAILNLKAHPLMGRPSELYPLLRELIVDGNVIYYQLMPDFIDIVAIRPRRTLK